MGVKVPKEIQEIGLLTLRLRTEGSALGHHPWWWWGGGGWGLGEGGRTCLEIQLNLSTTVTATLGKEESGHCGEVAVSGG